MPNLEQKVDDEQTLYTENLLVLGFEQIEYTWKKNEKHKEEIILAVIIPQEGQKCLLLGE